MKKDYYTMIDVTLVEQKKYLLSLCTKGRIQYKIYQCVSQKQLNKVIQNSQINKEFYQRALLKLYQCQDFESLEYHLCMMNIFFHNQDFMHTKERLFKKLVKKDIGIQEYCVIRHLIDFTNLYFDSFIQELHIRYDIDHLTCAKICLIEDYSHLAYEYLKRLDKCEDETVLQLLASYSIKDYLSLQKYYQQKKFGMVLLPVH